MAVINLLRRLFALGFTLALVLQLWPAAAYEVPANDMFAAATVLTDPQGSVPAFDLSSATEESGEPFFEGRCYWNPLENPERSVWFRFVPSHFGQFSADTYLHVTVDFLTGTELTNLQPVAGSTWASRRQAFMNKGQVYYIQLHDCSTDHMPIGLQYSFLNLPIIQTVTFPQPPDVPFSSEPIILQATADSGLPVEFSVFEGKATISGNILIPRSAGIITVGAWARGNEDYQASQPVVKTFTVTESAQSLPRPVNDQLSNAIDLGSATLAIIKGTTLGATHEPGEPGASNAVASVWYRWSPSRSGGAQFEIRGGTPQIFVVQPGPFPGDWIQTAVNNDPFSAQAGETYYIGVSAAAEPGPFDIEVYVSGPSNDDFADALPLRESNGSVEVTGTFWGATKEPGEPALDSGEGSIWYRWIPEQSGRLSYSLSPSGNGDIPDVWVFHAKGDSFDQLELLSTPSSRPFLIAGEHYYLAITSSHGPIRFIIGITSFRPLNDDFALADGELIPEAGPTPGESYKIQGTTLGATREPNEPPGPTGGPSVWYVFTPAMGGHYGISTSLGDLAVFEAKGPAIADLVFISTGELTYLKPHHTYYIAVYPHRGFEGSFALHVSRYASYAGGADNFSDATPFDFGYGGVASSIASTASAGLESGEPITPGSTGSTWYKFRVPFAARVRFKAEDGDAQFAIYQGDSIAGLAEVTGQVLDPDVLYHLSVSTSGAQYIALDATLIPADFAGALDSFDNALPVDRYVNSWTADPKNILYWEPWNFEGRFGSFQQGPLLGLMAAPASASRQVVLEPGKLYSLSFGYSSLGRTHVRVLVGGIELVTVPVDDPWQDWPSTNITFRAVSSLATITFENLEAGVTLWEPTLYCLEDSRNVQTTSFNIWTRRIEYTTDPFPLHSESGVPLVFSVEGPATLSGTTLNLNGPGTVTVHASQPGTDDFLPAREVTRTFYVTKKGQSITFDPAGPVAQNMMLRATASSGLPVKFQIVSGPATLTGDLLSFNGPGAVIVRAVQEGNDLVAEAPPVARLFVFAKLNQTIDLNDRSAGASARSLLSNSGRSLTAASVDNSPDIFYPAACFFERCFRPSSPLG